MRSVRCVTAALCALAACSDESNTSESVDAAAQITYWQHIAPLMADRCLACHSEGGIAPVQLDDYARTKSFASLIEHVTRERTMPPWSATSDGSCGEFSNSIALSEAEIALFSDWVQAGMPEGTPEPFEVSELPALADAVELATPNFVPEIQGGELAAFDEYRCFELEPPVEVDQFITGYEVVPGRSEIVHHVVGMLVDPDAPARLPEQPARTNAEQMRMLDAQSPDRDGWPCFGMAGEGIEIDAQPVAWGPGQGVVRFPDASGVPLRRRHKVILQVHYNLADARNIGKEDRTTVRLQLASNVERRGVFVLPDPLLDSLRSDAPVTLPPGKASTTYAWTQSMKEMGLPDDLDDAKLYGVAPHMHELGRKYQLTVETSGNPAACAVDVQRWDFHWQRMYFYAKPWTLTADSRISVTCDYDTTSQAAPVKPGWGTRNEMCLAALYLTLPHDD